MSSDLIFLAVVVSGFAATGLKVWRRRAAERPVREIVGADSWRVDIPVRAKLFVWPGYWNPKTLDRFQLRIGTRSAQIMTRPPGLAAFLGTDWVFLASEASIERVERWARDLPRRSWIILESRSAKSGTRVAVTASAADLDRCWNALVSAGFHTRPTTAS